MDESGSVGSANFDIMKTFVYNIADSFEIGPDDVQIGVMTYSSSHTFHFVLNTYTIKSQVLSAILSLPYGGGSTNTAGALDAIRLQAFTESNGAHPSAFGIPRVAVVITDGDSNDFAATVASANLLHDAGVITFAIGIAGANEAELDEIASEPSNKGFVSSFDAQRLRALQVSISQRACEGNDYNHEYNYNNNNYYIMYDTIKKHQQYNYDNYIFIFYSITRLNHWREYHRCTSRKRNTISELSNTREWWYNITS